MFRKLYVKWLVYRGKAVDIWSKSPYPANVLSNLYNNAFRFDGVECASMEGFLQSLKYEDCDEQLRICAMNGKDAKKMTTSEWQYKQTVWWRGRPIKRESDDFAKLVYRAYLTLFRQNETFRDALLSTKDKRLYHVMGETNPQRTILTEREFCDVLTGLRDMENGCF